MAAEEMRPVITPEVRALMELPDETVTAAALAPIVKMHPGVIIKYAKDGKWDLCRYVVSGNRVKFFRTDFLRKMGFIGEPPEENSREQILKELAEIREALAAILEEARKKTG